MRVLMIGGLIVWDYLGVCVLVFLSVFVGFPGGN